MDIIPFSDRPLFELYPREFNGDMYVTRNFNIPTRFVHIQNGTYHLIIPSPLSKSGYREYPFEIPESAKTSSNLQGILGENIARILLKEIFRREESKKGILQKRFLKDSIHIQTLPTAKYTATFNNTYNAIIKHKESQRTATDFDGVLQYQHKYKNKLREGYVIVEAKTGKLERIINSENNARTISRKVVNPIKDIFKDDPVDYFLVGDRKQLFCSTERKTYQSLRLKPPLAEFVRLLEKNNIGCIIQPFQSSSEEIQKASKDAFFLEKARKDLENIEVEIFWLQTGRYDKNGFTIFKKDGKRIGAYKHINQNSHIEIT